MSKFDVAEHVTELITAELEKGHIPWRKPFTFTGDSGMHRNFSSKRPYRGINQWLLEIESMRNGYTHPYWLTFKGAEKLGGKVRKGEKSTMVVFWKMIKVEDKETGKEKKIFLLRYFRVFNVAQCDGLPEMPEVETPKDFDPIEEAQAIIDGMPNAPEIHHDGRDRAFYAPAWDSVHLPVKSDFASPEAYYSVAFHELVHSTGHVSRLGRKEILDMQAFGDENYSREELTAEMGAAMLCAHAGILPSTLKNSAAYIENWLQALKNDKKMIVVAAGKAHAAHDYILDIKYAEDAE